MEISGLISAITKREDIHLQTKSPHSYFSRFRYSQPHFLVLVATSTEMKTRQYDGISAKLGAGILFRGLDDLVEAFHQVSENLGNEKEHADLKARSIQDIIKNCKIESSLENKILRQKCKEWGIAFDPSRIFFIADDASFSIGDSHNPSSSAKKIWKKLRKTLSRYVPDVMLDSAGKFGPAAETGPILAAVGVVRFFNLLRQAALEAKQSEVLFTDSCTCVLRRLSDPIEAQSITLNAKRVLKLFAPNGLHETFKTPKELIAETYNFFCLPSKPDQPISEYADEYLASHHVRADMVRQLHEVIAADLPEAGYKSDVREQQKEAAQQIASRRKKRMQKSAFIVQPTNSTVSISSIGHYQIKRRLLKKWEQLENILSLNFISDKGSRLTHADAFVLPEFKAGDQSELNKNLLMFFTIMDQKLTDPRYKKAPVVVMNGNGSWTPILNLYFEYVNNGMIKSYLLSPLLDQRETDQPIVTAKHTKHYATNLFDVVAGTHENQMEAAREVLDFRFRRYVRYRQTHLIDDTPYEQGTLRPKDAIVYTEFVSASSDNKILEQAGAKRGKWLAKDGISLFTGLGDRHGMGFTFHSFVKQAKQRIADVWCGGISTHALVKQESETGRIPDDYKYGELVTHIGKRIIKLFRYATVVGASPFGAGGIHEIAAGFVGRELGHPDVVGRPIVFNSFVLHPFCKNDGAEIRGENFFDSLIRLTLGEEALKKMKLDPTALADEGYYYVRSAKHERKIVATAIRDCSHIQARPAAPQHRDAIHQTAAALVA